MKIIQINVLYKRGSTGKITSDIHEELKKRGFNSIVLYGRGQKFQNLDSIKVCPEFYSHVNKVRRMLFGYVYGGCFFSTNKIIRIIKNERPDVVHLQCINGDFVNIYRLIAFLKKAGVKTVITLHAEFMYTGNCGYAFDCEKWKTGCGKCPVYREETGAYFFDTTNESWRKMRKAFDGFDNLIVASVSPWLMERAKLSPILAEKKHVVVLNGLDSSIFHYYHTEELRKKLGLEDKKVVFHATPNFNDDPNHIKGGYYILELAKKMPDITFIVAGSYKEGMDIPVNLILIGRVANQIDLAKYYSLADVTVITSKRETFSMIVAESLCCGTPVVGFKAGAPEQIAIKDFSFFSEYGNIDELNENIRVYMEKNISPLEIESEAHHIYSKSIMCDKYISLYKEKQDE